MSKKNTAAAAEATLEQQLEAANASIAEQKSIISALKAQVKDLTEQLQVKEATAGSKLPTVKVGETHHAFTTPKFRLKDGRTVTAEEAAKDADLCAELVKAGSGLLKPVSIK